MVTFRTSKGSGTVELSEQEAQEVFQWTQSALEKGHTNVTADDPRIRSAANFLIKESQAKGFIMGREALQQRVGMSLADNSPHLGSLRQNILLGKSQREVIGSASKADSSRWTKKITSTESQLGMSLIPSLRDQPAEDVRGIVGGFRDFGQPKVSVTELQPQFLSTTQSPVFETKTRSSKPIESFYGQATTQGGLVFDTERLSLWEGIKGSVKDIPILFGGIIKGEPEFKETFEPLQDTGYSLDITPKQTFFSKTVGSFFPKAEKFFVRPYIKPERTNESLGEFQLKTDIKAFEEGKIDEALIGLTGRPKVLGSIISTRETARIVSEEKPFFEQKILTGELSPILAKDLFSQKVESRFQAEAVPKFREIYEISKPVRKEALRREILGVGSLAATGTEVGLWTAGFAIQPEATSALIASTSGGKKWGSAILDPGLSISERALNIGLGTAEVGLGFWGIKGTPMRIRASAQIEKIGDLESAKFLSAQIKSPLTEDILVVSGKRVGTATQFQEITLGKGVSTGEKILYPIKEGKITTEIPGLFGGMDEPFAFAETKFFKGGIEVGKGGKIRPDFLISKNLGAIDFSKFESVMGTAFIQEGFGLRGVRFAGGVESEPSAFGRLFSSRETFSMKPQTIRIRPDKFTKEDFLVSRVFVPGETTPRIEARGIKNVLVGESRISLSGEISGRGVFFERGVPQSKDLGFVKLGRGKGRKGNDFSYLLQEQKVTTDFTIPSSSIAKSFGIPTITPKTSLISPRLGGVFVGESVFAGKGTYELTTDFVSPKMLPSVNLKSQMFVDLSKPQTTSSKMFLPLQDLFKDKPTSSQVSQFQPNLLNERNFLGGIVSPVQISGLSERLIQPSMSKEMLKTSSRTKQEFTFEYQPFDFTFRMPKFNMGGFRGFGFPGFFPPFGISEGGKRVKVKRKFKRRPSLAAVVLNIRETKPRKGEITGIALRPILPKYKHFDNEGISIKPIPI